MSYQGLARSIIAKIMAWIHLLLMNIGTAIATGLYVGYVGGAVLVAGVLAGGIGFLVMYRTKDAETVLK